MFAPWRRTASASRRLSPRPQLETLEDRVVPTTFFGLTTANQIVRFEDTSPSQITSTVSVTGLRSGESLVGFDFRPADGTLVGVGDLGGSGQVYTLNPTTGAATAVGGTFTLSGTNFGVNFNPVPNALRITSNTGQNLRITNGGAGTVNTDTPLSVSGGGTPFVVGSAYSDNVAGGGQPNGFTTLFDIDSNADALFTQGSRGYFTGQAGGVSPNSGVLTRVGALGVDTGPNVGFDISASDNAAFAALQVGSSSQLYTINLGTGAATLVGSIGGGSGVVLRALTLPTSVFTVSPDTAQAVGGNTATLTVTRTSGTAGNVTVDFATVPGTANTSHFLLRQGRLFFADGQTTQTISVPIRYTARPGGALTFTVQLTNPTGGASLGATSAATVIIPGDATAADFLDPNQRYVRQLFFDLLNRAPEQTALTFFTNLVSQPNGRAAAATFIASSPEAAGIQVDRLYTTLLNRSADSAGRAFWTNFLTTGGTVAQVTNSFVSSAEYFALRSGGDNTHFLQNVYFDVLGRAIDPSGQTSFLQSLNAGASRSAVVQAIQISAEGLRAQVNNFYTFYLGRQGEENGLTSFVTARQGGQTDLQTTVAFVTSTEYVSSV